MMLVKEGDTHSCHLPACQACTYFHDLRSSSPHHYKIRAAFLIQRQKFPASRSLVADQICWCLFMFINMLCVHICIFMSVISCLCLRLRSPQSSMLMMWHFLRAQLPFLEISPKLLTPSWAQAEPSGCGADLSLFGSRGASLPLLTHLYDGCNTIQPAPSL